MLFQPGRRRPQMETNMSSISDTGSAAGPDFVDRSGYPGGWRRSGRCSGRWSSFELLAMVLGFMVYWPIGLGIIAYKMVQRRRGPGEDWFNSMRQSFGGGGRPFSTGFRAEWGGFGVNRTGNAAFDEWRKAEIERLEAERRKLEEAQREFAEFADEARRARDREEFERFMARRPQA